MRKHGEQLEKNSQEKKGKGKELDIFASWPAVAGLLGKATMHQLYPWGGGLAGSVMLCSTNSVVDTGGAL